MWPAPPRKRNFLLTRGNFRRRQRVASRSGGNRLTTPQVVPGSLVAVASRESHGGVKVTRPFQLTVPGLLLAVKVAGVMVLDAVRELILGIPHVVDRVTVVMAMLVILAVQVVVLAEVVHHDVRHFHLVLRALHRPVEVHVGAGHRGVMMIVECAAVQRYHAGD